MMISPDLCRRVYEIDVELFHWPLHTARCLDMSDDAIVKICRPAAPDVDN